MYYTILFMVILCVELHAMSKEHNLETKKHSENILVQSTQYGIIERKQKQTLQSHDIKTSYLHPQATVLSKHNDQNDVHATPRAEHVQNDTPDTTTHKEHVYDIPDTTTHKEHVYDDITDTTTNKEHVYDDITDTTTNKEHVYNDIPDTTTHKEHVYNDIPDTTSHKEHVYNDIPDTTTQKERVYNYIPDTTTHKEHVYNDILNTTSHRGYVYDTPNTIAHKGHVDKDIPDTLAHKEHVDNDTPGTTTHKEHYHNNSPLEHKDQHINQEENISFTTNKSHRLFTEPRHSQTIPPLESNPVTDQQDELEIYILHEIQDTSTSTIQENQTLSKYNYIQVHRHEIANITDSATSIEKDTHNDSSFVIHKDPISRNENYVDGTITQTLKNDTEQDQNITLLVNIQHSEITAFDKNNSVSTSNVEDRLCQQLQNQINAVHTAVLQVTLSPECKDTITQEIMRNFTFAEKLNVELKKYCRTSKLTYINSTMLVALEMKNTILSNTNLNIANEKEPYCSLIVLDALDDLLHYGVSQDAKSVGEPLDADFSGSTGIYDDEDYVTFSGSGSGEI